MARKRSSSSSRSPQNPAGVRLQKVLAEAGIDSRRHCEEMIEEGRVSVNGSVVRKLPVFVDPDVDRIVVDGEPIRRPRRKKSGNRRELVYIMINKPKRVVCTNRDPEGRMRAVDLVDYPGCPRLFCVGRLDADSTGLLLLTNDGELANQLTHPRYGVHKTYELVVRGSLDAAAVEKVQEGIYLSDRKRGLARRTAPVRLKFLKRDRERTHLLMELREGRNRQIRRMMARFGYPVKHLKRVQLGPLRLSRLAGGHWRPLTAAELRSLRKAAQSETKTKTERRSG